MTAAAAVTKIKSFNTQHIMPVWLKFYKAAATDFVDTTQLTPAYKGFFPIGGFSFSTSACTAISAMQYVSAKVTTTTTAAATELVVDSIVGYVAGYARTPPYYILVQDATTTAFEVMEVTADSTPVLATSTLTVKRGCFGTTAAVPGVTDESLVYFLNLLYQTDTTIGTCIVYGIPFPADSKANLFGSQR